MEENVVFYLECEMLQKILGTHQRLKKDDVLISNDVVQNHGLAIIDMVESLVPLLLSLDLNE